MAARIGQPATASVQHKTTITRTPLDTAPAWGIGNSTKTPIARAISRATSLDITDDVSPHRLEAARPFGRAFFLHTTSSPVFKGGEQGLSKDTACYVSTATSSAEETL